MFNTRIEPEFEVKAIITRANGTIEDLGVIATNKVKFSFLQYIKKLLKINK